MEVAPRALLFALSVLLCAGVAAGDSISMIGFAVDEEGTVVRESGADQAVNPASVVKLATTLWALERLGPEHRFSTSFVLDGEVDEETGQLAGDLIAVGGADPDFHVENAVLVARALSREGLSGIAGGVAATGDFWLGWEGGSEGRRIDVAGRRTRMAVRLRSAIDSGRHDAAARRAVGELCTRREWTDCSLEGIPVQGRATGLDDPGELPAALVHRSNPLPVVLDRFNTWSNNDIERFGSVLGEPSAMARFLEERWGAESAAGIRFSTLSGLDSNRMTPRQIVRLLRDLDATARRGGLELAGLLGTAGCDEGTLSRFSVLAASPAAVTGKTGTLVQTDGGVVAFAGVAHTAEGRLFFAVLAPRNGARLAAARAAQERWVLSLADAHGGLVAGECPPGPPHSDRDVRLEPAEAP